METLKDFLAVLDAAPWAMGYAPIGSKYTCNPPPANSDTDYVILVSEYDDPVDALECNGFNRDGSETYEMTNDRFVSLKRRLPDGTLVNAILTKFVEFFDNSVAAADVCKALNLMERPDRVKVHKIIVDGYTAEEIEKERADAEALTEALADLA